MQDMNDPYKFNHSPSKAPLMRRESTRVSRGLGLFRDNYIQQLETLEEKKEYQPERPYLNKNIQINLHI